MKLNLNKKLPLCKATGSNHITNKILKNLSLETIALLTHIYYARLILSHCPAIHKFSVTLLILKSDKPKHLSTSYRSIKSLHVLVKLFEKVLLKRLRPILQSNLIILNKQLGFCNRHSTIHQLYRPTDEISTILKSQQYYPGLFSALHKPSIAFGLIYKLKLFMPIPNCLIL